MAAEGLCKLIFRNSFAPQVLMDIVKGVFTLTFPSFFFGWVTHLWLLRLLLYLANILEPLLCDRYLVSRWIGGEQNRHDGLHSLLVEIVVLSILNHIKWVDRNPEACESMSLEILILVWGSEKIFLNKWHLKCNLKDEWEKAEGVEKGGRQKKETNSKVPQQKGIKHTKELRGNLARAQRMRENVVKWAQRQRGELDHI